MQEGWLLYSGIHPLSKCIRILGDMTLTFGKGSFKYRREQKTNSEVLHWDWRSPCKLLLFGTCVCIMHRSIDTDVRMCVCWDGRGKGEMSLAQLVVPVIRDSSRKDWRMSAGHRKSLERAPTGAYWG